MSPIWIEETLKDVSKDLEKKLKKQARRYNKSYLERNDAHRYEEITSSLTRECEGSS